MSSPPVGSHTMRRRLLLSTVAALLLTACGQDDESGMSGQSSPNSSGMNEEVMADMSGDAPQVPPVFGYYAGDEVFFIHTETSDADISMTLETMMGSPVPVVESLAHVPDGARSTVYVFTNGIVPTDTPSGPLGFAPDVFDSAPGGAGYTPLRGLMLVTWANAADARLLTSEQEILAAEAGAELAIENTGIVVNMPMLSWPGGER